jgi:hypothetical protein
MLGFKSNSFSIRRSQGCRCAGFLLPNYGGSKAMGARKNCYTAKRRKSRGLAENSKTMDNFAKAGGLRRRT